MSQEAPPARAAQAQFGQQAASYAGSLVHSSGQSLEAVVEYAAMGRYPVALDLGSGAGFTAFALADFADYVLATDIAPQMVVEAGRLAEERGVTNVGLALVEAESLPFAADSLDLVSTRWAAHHFHDLPAAVSEIQRVLKPGAACILADTVAPEEEAEAIWMNRVERLRDSSHQRNLKVSQWRELLEGSGFEITHDTMTKVDLEFEEWVRRASTPSEEVEALRREFLTAPEAMVAAFGIQIDGDAINFSWDTLVLRAVKG